MKISEKQKTSIVNIIFGMKDGEILWMKDFMPEEREYIIHLCEYQTGALGFLIETNGSETDFKTITKLRKRFT